MVFDVEARGLAQMVFRGKLMDQPKFDDQQDAWIKEVNRQFAENRISEADWERLPQASSGTMQ
jgi:hypothetical protein